MRRGRRIASANLVLHFLTSNSAAPARAGFIVGKVAGNSVARHRLIRQLRHAVSPLLAGLPAGTELVVRAIGPVEDPRPELFGLLAKAGLHA